LGVGTLLHGGRCPDPLHRVAAAAAVCARQGAVATVGVATAENHHIEEQISAAAAQKAATAPGTCTGLGRGPGPCRHAQGGRMPKKCAFALTARLGSQKFRRTTCFHLRERAGGVCLQQPQPFCHHILSPQAAVSSIRTAASVINITNLHFSELLNHYN
jgi:hypothetical protein